MKLKITFVFLIYSMFVFSQEAEHQLKFNSVDISPLGFYLNNETDGIAFSIAVTLKKDKNLFKLFGLAASELETPSFGPTNSESFSELSVLYGRNILIRKSMYIDGFLGFGYFSHTQTTSLAIPGSGGGGLFSEPNYDNVDYHTSTIGFPIQGRIGFQTGKRFSLGLQLHSNINSIKTYYSSGLFLQWKF